MSRKFTIGVVSDIHFASTAEQARGDDYESRNISNPLLRWFLKAYRHFIWLRHPLQHNDRLDEFLERVGDVDVVVANGDYSCDSAFVGVSDDAAFQSAEECLSKLRGKFASAFRATIGDHELGKFSFVGKQGGLRLASFNRLPKLGLEPFWMLERGSYVIIGVASSLIALPVFEPETLPGELAEWQKLRTEHMEKIRRAFDLLKPNSRVILFCHDPTALPFLYREEAVRKKLGQIELTIIGHLHSGLILWKSRLLAGMPEIRFMGHSVRRMSRALHEARHWKSFHVQLCPSLAGTELLKDGGFLKIEIDLSTAMPVSVNKHRLPR
jgi:hypothetical protein